jgi:3-hydroxybutyrate dehydrogenase
VASVHSVRASPFKAAYVSAKHGLAGLTKVVALETAGSGVTCNAVSPGFVDTPILQMQVQALADKEKLSYAVAKAKFLASYHPTKDAVGIDQIGEMVAFLCSDAASQTTGSNVIIDGGWCAK